NDVVKEKFLGGESLVVNIELDNPRSESLELEFAFFDSGGCKLWNFTHDYHDLPPISPSLKPRVRIVFFVPVIQVTEVFVHVGLRVKGFSLSYYADHIDEGLRYIIEKPADGTYRPTDSLFPCAVEFQEIMNE